MFFDQRSKPPDFCLIASTEGQKQLLIEFRTLFRLCCGFPPDRIDTAFEIHLASFSEASTSALI